RERLLHVEFQIVKLAGAPKYVRAHPTVEIQSLPGTGWLRRAHVGECSTLAVHALDQCLDPTAGLFRTQQPRGNYPCVVEDDDVAASQQVGQIREAPVAAVARCIEMEQARAAARRCGT